MKVQKIILNKTYLRLTLIIFLILLPTLAMIIFRPKVRLYFEPNEISLPENSYARVSIVADSGAKDIAFARVAFSFDPASLSLSGDIVTNPNLSTVVSKTDTVTANRTGKVVLVVAASPTDNPPSGVFELASVQFSRNPNKSGNLGLVSFNTKDMQMVESRVAELPVVPGKMLVKF